VRGFADGIGCLYCRVVPVHVDDAAAGIWGMHLSKDATASDGR